MIRIILSHFGLLQILSGALQAATPLPPNILFLFADDWCYLSDSQWAGQGVKTPAFDRYPVSGQTEIPKPERPSAKSKPAPR